ncbi:MULTISPECIES: type VI secretion system contractile sheath small subunit [Sphingosinicellaceae]|uniref:type VI secretion system contractile sheath small subunit n=1 Tax=Sphingosinicellaceae TaxID=2820280 RepID=UPI001C1E334C|nr:MULTISPECIES: type VI secretion system contractile sheath small subunit [Polymorphobacter]QYE35385.1 type VI secretion system contractile sheath small subunit [Polymorphobacter sp. PAMC 29334]UAJ11308.1 type VI secretion system contractile sheath small subunit [Polymorphobacter megasporae]
MDSVHDKLKKVRKPRVHITYDVETEGAVEVKELPFVVGVMGDFSGDPTEPLAPLKDRKFIQIDRDNFDQVLRRMAPGLQYRVENTLAADGSEMVVNLKFESIEDFEPGRVIEQVKPLKHLLETRNKLRDLMTKADGSEQLENLLESILKDQSNLDRLKRELDPSAETPTTPSKEA